MLITVAAYHKSPSALHAEIMAIRNALNYIHTSLNIREDTIIIESNSIDAINFITDQFKDPPTVIMTLLSKIKFMTTKNRFQLSHIRRKGNRSTNWLTVFAKKNVTSQTWTENWSE